MINEILPILGISLGLTILIEEALAFLAGIRSSKDLILVFLINLLTNPAAVLCYYFLTFNTQMNTLVAKILTELAVILIEYLYYKKYAGSINKPFLFSVSVNVFSFATGLVLNAII